MLDTTLFQSVEGVKRPISQETLMVKLSSAISDVQVNIYLSVFNNAFSKVNSNLEIDKDTLKKYFNTIAKWRVDFVNGKRVPLENKQILIPSVYAIAILHVGKVYDPEQGLHLVPSFEIDDVDLLTPEEMLALSDGKLRILRDLGCSFEYGLPKVADGSLEAMYFHFAESQVLRHDNRCHPGIAALASFFEFQQVQTILSHRVSYGYISEQDLILRQIIMKAS